MSARLHVRLLGVCSATGPVVDALRSHARLERVSPSEHVATVEEAEDGADAVARRPQCSHWPGSYSPPGGRD
jgi:hypothetical protein